MNTDTFIWADAKESSSDSDSSDESSTRHHHHHKVPKPRGPRQKVPLKQWPQLMHRTLNKRLIAELESNYPDYYFEVYTVFENAQPLTIVDPIRVRIYTDNDGVIVKIPRNG